MANKIIVKTNSVAHANPSSGDLDAGELAFNKEDGKLFSSSNGSDIVEIGGGGRCDKTFNCNIQNHSLISLSSAYSPASMSIENYKGTINGVYKDTWIICSSSATTGSGEYLVIYWDSNDDVTNSANIHTVGGAPSYNTIDVSTNNYTMLDYKNGHVYILRGWSHGDASGTDFKTGLIRLKLSDLSWTTVVETATYRGNSWPPEQVAYISKKYHTYAGEERFHIVISMSQSTSKAIIWSEYNMATGVQSGWYRINSSDADPTDPAVLPSPVASGRFKDDCSTRNDNTVWWLIKSYKNYFNVDDEKIYSFSSSKVTRYSPVTNITETVILYIDNTGQGPYNSSDLTLSQYSNKWVDNVKKCIKVSNNISSIINYQKFAYYKPNKYKFVTTDNLYTFSET